MDMKVDSLTYNKIINTRFEKQWTQGFTTVSGVSRSSYRRSALIHSVYRHAAHLPTAQLSAVVQLSINKCFQQVIVKNASVADRLMTLGLSQDIRENV